MTEIQASVARSRAFEAVLWGVPAVNYRLMYDAGTAAGMSGDNQILWWPGLMDWQNQSLTPNPDVIYLMPFFTTANGPVVLEIPPAEGDSKINGSVMNYWQAAIEDVGPAGLDAGAGAKYLILPPGHTDPVPDGYTPLQSDTVQGYALLRSLPADQSKDAVAQAVAYAERIALYPYTPDGATGETVRVDLLDKPYDATIRYDTSYFETLNTLVQAEPWLDRDRALIDQLATLGIVQGQPYTPDQATLDSLTAGMNDAKNWLEAGYRALFDSPYWAGTRWAMPAMPALVESTNAGFTLPNAYPVDDRGLAYTFAFFSSRHLGKGQSYLMAIADQDGQDLDGGQNYKLTVTADVPVSQYWSLTVYSSDTHTLLKNATRLSRSSLNPDLVTNQDGTVDLYFGPQAPAGHESNWLPTFTDTGFEVMFRLYGPQDAYTDKTWSLPDLQRL
ncbi:DUF1214 domain-containing protein [Streptomyces xanthochromogenes]|uniref:DUF1214 domain-containing protein n=1 Tax=Streptomyces xanthochromogenes TaxID=67384 RepID=UPI00380D947B